jgi:hypothetical protein
VKNALLVTNVTTRNNLSLALQVLVQRIAGPSSHFATYISYLPVGVSGVPMFFPREALEAIEYPPVVEQVRGVRLLLAVLHLLLHGFVSSSGCLLVC